MPNNLRQWCGNEVIWHYLMHMLCIGRIIVSDQLENCGKVIVACRNIWKVCCYHMYHPLRRLRSTEFCPNFLFMGFFWLSRARFPYAELTGVKLYFVVCRWGKNFESIIYTHFRFHMVNIALMLPCELAEEIDEQSDDILRTNSWRPRYSVQLM